MIYETQKNTIEFKVYGKYALFTDPITKTGGEKCSYQIPTYEAIKGICKSIYWKPTFIWIVDEIKVVNKIDMETKGVRPIKYNGGNELSIYTFLKDVEYKVRAHFEWNLFSECFKQDRNEGKHYEIAKRALDKGGRQDIFLGTRDCQGYVEPCVFNENEDSFYKNTDKISFGVMFHSFGYPNETGMDKMITRLWQAEMNKGVIKFPKPDECKIVKEVKNMKQSRYIMDRNILSVEKEYSQVFLEKEGKI